MDVYSLRNFLTIASLGNITHAAESLHISQPALSMQLKKLEKELGTALFERRSRRLELTPAGLLLKERAEQIVGIVDKTVAEFGSFDDLAGGEIRIGLAESHLVSTVAQSFAAFKKTHPLVTFDLLSGGTEQVLERLARGLVDLAIIVEPPDLERYHFVEIPGEDVWGAIITETDPLAELDAVTIDDLIGRELIISKQSLEGDLPRWAGDRLAELRIVGHYNLAYNGAIFAREGLGVMLSFDKLVSLPGMTFRPLSPTLRNKMFIVWQKGQEFSPIVREFARAVKDIGAQALSSLRH